MHQRICEDVIMRACAGIENANESNSVPVLEEPNARCTRIYEGEQREKERELRVKHSFLWYVSPVRFR